MMKLKRIVTVAMFMLGVAGLAAAQTLPVPEIDPGTGMNAIALLAGAALVIRAGLKK
jgi:hypothetical protein